MSPPSKMLSVLVLTEDGGKTAFETVTALTKKLLRYLDPNCDNNQIAFEPATDEAREILVANQFTNRRDPRRRRLYQVIATQLRLGDGFVVHHFDADRPWRERDRNAPLAARPVQKEILDHVRVLLATRGVDDAEIDEMLGRYLRLVPYAEIEAWLYQNTEQARAFACGMPHCGCLMQLTQWRADRGLLDEVPDPPAALPCVGKRHNLALVAGLPVKEVYAAGKSLAPTLDAMLGCDALLLAIQGTYESGPVSPVPA